MASHFKWQVLLWRHCFLFFFLFIIPMFFLLMVTKGISDTAKSNSSALTVEHMVIHHMILSPSLPSRSLEQLLSWWSAMAGNGILIPNSQSCFKWQCPTTLTRSLSPSSFHIKSAKDVASSYAPGPQSSLPSWTSIGKFLSTLAQSFMQMKKASCKSWYPTPNNACKLWWCHASFT